MKKLQILLACALFAMLFSTNAQAQLSGAYTINGSSPTSGTNYQTFTAAVSALTTSGVSGAVTFNVAAGTYTEQISIPTIAGASASKTITFKGLGNSTVLSATPTTTNLPVLSLDSASHIIVDSLKIEVLGTNGWAVQFMNMADSNVIRNCNIQLPVIATCSGIVGSTSISSLLTSGLHTQHLLLENNTINGGGYGIILKGISGASTGYGADVTILGNTVTNSTLRGVDLSYNSDIVFSGNTVSSSESTSTGAISFWDAGYNITVTENKFYTSSNVANTRVVVFAMAPANGSAGFAAQPIIFANNFVHYEGSNATAPTGLLVKNKAHVKIYNNTFKVKNQGAAANCIWLDNNNARSLDGVEVRNNVMTLKNSGSGQFIYCGSATVGARFKNIVVDHNNYYAPNGYFKTIIPNGTGISTYTSLSALKANTKGWATGALNVDPGFVSATDLHATSFAMNDSAAVISIITTDIDGDIRSLTMPDMGADEYTPSPCQPPASVNTSNVTAFSATINFIASGNKFPIEYGPVGFSQGTGLIDTAFGTGHILAGLTTNTDYDFYIRNDCTDSLSVVSSWVGPYNFHTLCSFTNAYFTNWDQLANNETDFCWKFLAGGSTSAYAKAYAPSASATPQPHSGANYYRIYNSASVANYLVSPEITDLDSNTLQLRFQGLDSYTGSIGTPNFIIGTMASQSNSASFVAIDTINTTTNLWTEYTVVLDNVPAGHKHVVIRHGNNTNYVYMGIDDLHIESQPACIPPSSGTFASTTDSSTIISWSSGDASMWEIEYGVSGFSQGTGTMITGLTSATDTILGLAPQTCYDFYIRGNCTLNNSTWYGPVTVCTECAIAVAPFLENFDGPQWVTGTTTNAIDQCWSRNPTANSTFRWESRSGSTTSSSTGPTADASGTGKYIYTESSYGTTGGLTTLETPEIDFSSLAQPTLSFAYHMYGATIGSLYVLISNGSQYDTLQVISGQQQSTSAAAWKTTYININSYKALPRIIRFVGKKGSSYTGDIAIDEVSVAEVPSCLLPTNFTVDSVSSTLATFSWNTVTTNTNFIIEYGPKGFVQGTGNSQKAWPTGTTGTLTGLMVNTQYHAYLADACDSTVWVGPISFTTLIDDDAQLTQLVSPGSGLCGDSSLVVQVKVKNNGLNAITSLPVGANVSGSVTATLNNVFTGSIAPGASATITVGTINAYYGGVINIDAFTALVGDQNGMNDTLTTDSIELISVVPLHYPIASICPADTMGQFAAVSQTGIVNNWYINATDSVPFSTSDTVSALPNQTLYLDRSKEVEQFIFDGTTGSLFGNMFKLYIKNDITFTGFTFEVAWNGASLPIAFYKQGEWRGHETTRADWTVIDSVLIPGTIQNNWYQLTFTNPVTFNAGDTISLYLANKNGSKIKANGLVPAVDSIGELYLSNNEIEYYAGVGGAYFGNNMATNLTSPQAVSTILHYTTKSVCGNNRIALTQMVNTDTAMASFVFMLNANGADVDVDASASTGHVFDWDFGDGNTGSGMLTTHTYAAAGSYTITLVVTDTLCGTSDTLAQTVLSTIGIAESLLDRSLLVYPNPNNGTFRVSFKLEGVQDVELALLSNIGQVVYNEDLGAVAGKFEKDLVIQNLAPGVYFLRVSANGKPSTFKITVY